MNNYEKAIHYLDAAFKHAGNSNEASVPKNLIKHSIIEFSKLLNKQKRSAVNKTDNKKLSFPHPEKTIELIDNWIKEENSNALNDN